MMKILILALALVSYGSAFAGDCSGLPSKIDNDTFYAEVISRSHTDLEFVFVRKDERAFKYKIVGGENFSPQMQPSCSGPEALLERASDNVIVSRVSGGNSSFYGIFKICMTDYLNRPVGEATLCGWETGD